MVGLWGVQMAQMHKMMRRRHGGREECMTTLQGVARKTILLDQELWDCCCCSTRLLHLYEPQDSHPQAHLWEECKTTLQGVARKMILLDQEPWDCCCCSTRLLHRNEPQDSHPQAHLLIQIQTAPAKNLGCESAHSPTKHSGRCAPGYLQTTLEKLEPRHLQRVGHSRDCVRLACSAVAKLHIACHQVCLPSRSYIASSPVELWNFCHGSPGGT